MEIDTWLTCRRQHWFAKVRNLVPQVEPRGPVWLGRGLHYGIAAWYREGRDPIEAWDEWLSRRVPPAERADLYAEDREDLDRQDALARGILLAYRAYSQQHDRAWQVISVEQPYEVLIPGINAALIGTIDLLVRYHGRLWIVDHKTVSAFADPRSLEFDWQCSAYLYLVHQIFGELPAGVIYNQIKKVLPQKPRVLKDGSLSKALYANITHGSYIDAIRDVGADPADYRDILDDLSKRPDQFHQRELITHSAYELEHFGQTLAGIVGDMVNPATPAYPHMVKSCSTSCTFNRECKAMSEGGDFESLITRHYRVAEGREE